jgi:hypothetical protein
MSENPVCHPRRPAVVSARDTTLPVARAHGPTAPTRTRDPITVAICTRRFVATQCWLVARISSGRSGRILRDLVRARTIAARPDVWACRGARGVRRSERRISRPRWPRRRT